MISFDLIYKILAMSFGVLALLAVYYIRKGLKDNYYVFLAMIFNRQKRVYLAFIALFISAVLLVVGYGITFMISLSNPATLDWEYINVFMFFFFVMFLFIIGLNYKKYTKKTPENGIPPSSESPVESLNKAEQPEKPEEDEPKESDQNIDQNQRIA